MAKQIYIDENGNPISVSGTINTAELLPISGNDTTDTKSYIDTGLSGKTTITTDYFSIENITLVNDTDYAKYIDVSKTGYTPIGIIGYLTTGNYCTRIHFNKMRISGTQAELQYRASGETLSSNNISIGVYVLYTKN